MDRRHALYPGTFDPPTLGHLDILSRALELFDRVTVAVAATGKEGFLPLDRRLELLAGMLPDPARCRVVPLDGLMVAEMRRQGTGVVVRGIRDGGDYQHERRLAAMNRTLLPEAEAVFLMARPEVAGISSSLVREVARHGGDVSGFVTPAVAAAVSGLRRT